MHEFLTASLRLSLRIFAWAHMAVAAIAFVTGGNALAATAQKKAAPKAAAKPKPKEAPAKEVRAWSFSRQTGTPTLVYGVVNGNPVVSFSCQPEIMLMRVVTHIGTRGVKPGDGTPVRLSNGNVRMEFAGTAFSTGDANDTVDIAGATKIDQKFFGLFRAGDTLLLDIPGRKRGLPVRAAAQSAEAFEKACLTR